MSAVTNTTASFALDMSQPSLCIPRVFPNITEKRIAFVIRDVGLGEIARIDMVPKTAEDGTKFQRVFIHFKRWSDSESAQRARERVLGGKEIKIIYDDPWFWKLSANRAVARTNDSSSAPRHKKPQSQRPRPRLVDDMAASDNDRKPRNSKHLRKVAPKSREPSAEPQEFVPRSPDCSPPRSPDCPPPRSPDCSPEIQPDADGAWEKVDYGKSVPPPVKPKGRRVTMPGSKTVKVTGVVTDVVTDVDARVD